MLIITKSFPKAFDFCEILKMHEKIFENPQFFVAVLYCTVPREDAHR